MHADVLSAETKTKTGNLSIDRQSLWTKKTKKIYQKSEFTAVMKLAKKSGLKFPWLIL